jgi:hypothetical protein
MFSREKMSSRAVTKAVVWSRGFKRGKRTKIPQRLFSTAMELSCSLRGRKK